MVGGAQIKMTEGGDCLFENRQSLWLGRKAVKGWRTKLPLSELRPQTEVCRTNR